MHWYVETKSPGSDQITSLQNSFMIDSLLPVSSIIQGLPWYSPTYMQSGARGENVGSETILPQAESQLYIY